MATTLVEIQEENRLETLATLKPTAYEQASPELRPEINPGEDFVTLPDKRLLDLRSYLEQVTILFLQVCNTQNRSILEAIVNKFVAPTFLVHKAETFQSLSRDAYVRGKLALWSENPTFRLNPRLTTAFVEEDKGRALVFSTNSITGTVPRRPELTREEVTVNHFERRKNGDWICTKFETLRGPGHWTFEVGHLD